MCLVYLLNRKWKPLFLAAGIDIAGWIATGILTDTGIVTLLKETFSSGTASGEQYLGLLSFLLSFGWEKSLILILNVIIGIGYTLVLWLYLKKSCALEENALILYAPACIASTFWIYKNGTDYLILAFAAAFFVLLGIREQVSKRDFWICVLGTAYLEMSRCAVYLGVVLLEETSWGRNLVKSIDGFILGIVGVILCRLWVKYYGRNASYAR